MAMVYQINWLNNKNSFMTPYRKLKEKIAIFFFLNNTTNFPWAHIHTTKPKIDK